MIKNAPAAPGASDTRDAPGPNDWASICAIVSVWAAARVFRFWGLGLYWDDWRIFTRGMEAGARGIFGYLAGERLLMGLPHALLYSIFGPRPVVWHAANLLLELGIGLLIFFLLKRILRGYLYLPALAACLFLAYPLSIIRGHMMNVYINCALLLSLLSLWLTSAPLRIPGSEQPRGIINGPVILAALLIPFYLLIYEMPIGLEAVRLWILWQIASRRRSNSRAVSAHAVDIAARYLPYLAGLIIFLAARIYLYPRVAEAMAASMRSDMGFGRLGMPAPYEALVSFVHILVAAWINAAHVVLSMGDVYHWSRLMAWLFAIGTAVFVLWQLARRSDSSEAMEAANPCSAWWLLVAFGLASMGALLLPIWMHPESYVFYTNLGSRHGYLATIPAALVCLGALGLISRYLFPPPSRASFLLLGACGLIGVGVAYNQLLTEAWIEEWQHTRTTWQQIINRVPNLAKGTLIVLVQPKSFKALGIQVRGRDIYEPAQLFYHLKYGEVYGSPLARNTENLLPWLGWGDWKEKTAERPVDPAVGAIHRDAILVLDETQGSLKVLERAGVTERTDPSLAAAALFCNPAVIQNGPPADASLFRRRLLGETVRDWPFYYARAGWHQQQGAWKELAQDYAEIKKRRLRPDNPSEWLPFLEGVVRAEEMPEAREILVWLRAAPAGCRESAAGLLKGIRHEGHVSAERLPALDEEIRFLQYRSLPEIPWKHGSGE